MKNFIFFLFILTFSCQSGVSVEVENQSDEIINKIILSNGLDSLNIEHLEPLEKRNVFLKFNKINKLDGSYMIEFNMNNQKLIKNFGYYSNGIPTNSSYLLIISKDSISVREYPKNN